MRRSVLAVTVLCVGVLLFSAAMATAATEIKLGHVLNTEHPWHICLKGFAEDVKEATDGEVVFKIYHSSQLGNEKDLIEGLQLGTVDAGLIGGASFQSTEPKMGAEEPPFAWKDHQTVYRAFDGKLGDHLIDLMAKKGVIGLAWWENGFRNITNSKRPIEKPADLKGLKLRVTPNQMRLDTFKALGASPVPMDFGELYSALQQGVVDGQENPLAIIYGHGLYEVQRYLSLTHHIWGSAFLCVREGIWKELSEEQQSTVLQSARKWRDKEREMIQESDRTYTEKLKETGMEINQVDIAPFQEAVQPVWEKYEDVFGSKVMDLVREYAQ